MPSRPLKFRDLMRLWTVAAISDKKFIEDAELVGCGDLARKIIQRDLDIPK